MAYAKPNTFADGTTLTAADVQGNVDALRVYLHNGIVQPDLTASQFITTRHIQPPTYSALEGLQHGVTGYQGGQWSGSLVRLQFATSYTAGNGRNTANGEWTRVPNTAFAIDIRRSANILFHWQIEVEAGPDDVPQVSGRTNAIDDRHAFFAPYFGAPDDTKRFIDAQEVQNNIDGFRSSSPFGPSKPYTVCNGYGQRSGVLAKSGITGTPTFGLCAWSQIDRSAVVNWSIALEVWYL